MTKELSSRGGIRAAVATPWHTLIVLASVYAVSEFMTSAKTREYAERDYAAEKAFLTELGLAKK